jgi:hypothetical protein
VQPFLSLQASNLFSPEEIGHQGWLLEEKPGIYATVSTNAFIFERLSLKRGMLGFAIDVM